MDLDEILYKTGQALIGNPISACLFFVFFNERLIYFNLNYGHIVFPYLYDFLRHLF